MLYFCCSMFNFFCSVVEGIGFGGRKDGEEFLFLITRDQ